MIFNRSSSLKIKYWWSIELHSRPFNSRQCLISFSFLVTLCFHKNQIKWLLTRIHSSLCNLETSNSFYFYINKDVVSMAKPTQAKSMIKLFFFLLKIFFTTRIKNTRIGKKQTKIRRGRKQRERKRKKWEKKLIEMALVDARCFMSSFIMKRATRNDKKMDKMTKAFS